MLIDNVLCSKAIAVDFFFFYFHTFPRKRVAYYIYSRKRTCPNLLQATKAAKEKVNELEILLSDE